MNEKFKTDLADGIEYERIVIDKLNSLWNNLFKKNDDNKWVDVLFWNYTMEIKRDNKSKETGNYYFETSCWSKPSWIYKYEWVKLWVHWTDEYFSVILYDDLVKALEKAYSVWWWDWWASRWKILPVKKVEQIALLNINL